MALQAFDHIQEPSRLLVVCWFFQLDLALIQVEIHLARLVLLVLDLDLSLIQFDEPAASAISKSWYSPFSDEFMDVAPRESKLLGSLHQRNMIQLVLALDLLIQVHLEQSLQSFGISWFQLDLFCWFSHENPFLVTAQAALCLAFRLLSSGGYARYIGSDQFTLTLHAAIVCERKRPPGANPTGTCISLPSILAGRSGGRKREKRQTRKTAMKTKKQNANLVPIADALNGFEKLYINPVDKAEQSERSTVWAEPQLYLLPFCVPQDKAADRLRSIKITETIKIGDKVQQRTFRVNPDPELGLPGSFDLEVMTGINRIADEQMSQLGTVPEFLELGSFRTFLALIGKPCTGKYIAMLKESLKRLMSTTCISEGFFYSKPRDLYLAESFTFISSVEIAGEYDFNGNQHDKTRVKLHEFIRENLNANFRTLIDFDHLRQLRTDIAKPLALHIAYRMFKNKRSEWEPDYKWLAERLAIKVYDDMRAARKQLKAALDELKCTGFIDCWEWHDKRLKLVAGPHLVQMHQRRVAAKDAWLAHQQEKVRVEQLVISLPPRTGKEHARQEAFDPLAGLCVRFAAYGWKAVAKDAGARGLTEDTLTAEAISRGHHLKPDS